LKAFTIIIAEETPKPLPVGSFSDKNNFENFYTSIALRLRIAVLVSIIAFLCDKTAFVNCNG
jgi:hypothetical protein